MRALISAKKAPGAGSPIARRCGFVGHLRNAENAAAVIGLLASIAVDCAGVSGVAILKQCPDRMRHPPSSAAASCGPRQLFQFASAPTGDRGAPQGPVRVGTRPMTARNRRVESVSFSPL